MSNVQFNNVNYVAKKFIGKMQTAVNIRISVKKEISQVLSVGSESDIVSYEPTTGACAYYGKTNIKFVYNDGMGVVSSNYNADFTADIQSDLLNSQSKVIFDVITVDTKVDTTANTALITILLEISVYAYNPEIVSLLVGGEDIFAKRQDIALLQRAEVYHLPFVIDQELVSSQSIDTILLAESNLCVTDCNVANGVMVVKGNATVRLSYTCNGEIVTDVLPFEFVREVDAGDVNYDFIQCYATVRCTKVRLNIAEEGENINFSVDIACNLQVESLTYGNVEIVTDAYATDCDFRLDKQQITTTLGANTIVAKREFSASLPNDDNKKLKTTLNVSGIVTKCIANQGYATVDGIVYATALYDDESEVLEIPFSQKVEADYLVPNCNAMASVSVPNFILQQENGLTAQVTLCITLQSDKDAIYTVTTSATEIPFDKGALPTMEVCLARKGESLWELAKSLHTSTEEILAVNGDLTDPLTTDARIVVFNHI